MGEAELESPIQKINPMEKKPSIGSERTISRFIWLPLKVNGQSYWLEWITVKQWFGVYVSGRRIKFGWLNVHVIDHSRHHLYETD